MNARYSVYRDDPQDPEGNGCIDERHTRWAAGGPGYRSFDEAKARADHAAQGEYGRTRLYVRRTFTTSGHDWDTVYSRWGLIDPPTDRCDFDPSHLAGTSIACPACYIPGAYKGD